MRVVNAGGRITVTDDKTGKIVRPNVWNKFERRIIRKVTWLERSKIEKKLHKLRLENIEVGRLATNSHEARRYREAALKERQRTRFAAARRS
jgi:hypothetical protein